MDFSTNALSEFFWRSPIGSKLRADASAERREQRAAAEKALVDLAAKEHKDLARLAAAKAAATAEFFRARENLRLAERKRTAASYQLMGAELAFGNQREKHEKFLRDSADGELRQFLDKLEAARQPAPLSEMFQAETRIDYFEFGPPRPVCLRHNASQIEARVRAIASAEREAQRLAETRADFSGDLVRLEKTIPDWRLPVKV